MPVGRAFANPGATPSFRHARARGLLSKYNFTEDLLEKQADWLIFQEREKIEELCKGIFFRFYACISSLLIKPELHSEIGSYRRETTFFFGY